MVAALSGFYLYQAGDLITNHYLIKKYSLQLGKITNEALVLQAQAAAGASFSEIENKMQTQGFEKVSEIKYLSVKSPTLAAKK